VNFLLKLEILSYLDNNDKVNITSLSKYLYGLRKYLTFTREIILPNYYEYYTNLGYYDNYTRVLIKSITPGMQLPRKLTHLTFGKNFNQNIHGLIPWGVTHLTLSKRYDYEILEP